MNRRTLVLVTALLGGLAWVVRWILQTDDGLSAVVYWVGLVLLAIAVAGLGAGLVSRSALWLQAIVAVAFPLLVWSVIEVFTDSFDEDAVDGVAGIAVALLAVLVSRPRRGAETARRARHGAHTR